MNSEVFSINAVVLASYSRYREFKRQLSGYDSYGAVRNRFRFKRGTMRAVQKIKRLNRQTKILQMDDANGEENILLLSGYGLVVSAAYPQVFSGKFLAGCNHNAINFHPSFLPKCRGAYPIYGTVAAGEDFGGLTCHYMTEKLDGGPVLRQRKIHFNKNTITREALFRLIKDETPSLIRDVETYFMRNESPLPQTGAGSYFRNAGFYHRRIDFAEESACEISAKIRAGGAFAYSGGGCRVLLGPPADISENSGIAVDFAGVNPAAGSIIRSGSGKVTFAAAGGLITARYYLEPRNRALRILKKTFPRKYFHLKKLPSGGRLC